VYGSYQLDSVVRVPHSTDKPTPFGQALSPLASAWLVGLDRVGDGGELALFLGTLGAALESICPLHQHAMLGVAPS
jgi:hypothetical protein